MSLDDLSLNERVDRVDLIRDEILRHSNILSDYLLQLGDVKYDQKIVINTIHREIRTIIKELNKMSGFCDKNGRSKISLFSETGAWFTIFSTVNGLRPRTPLIRYWTTNTNPINLDYSSYPFKITAGLELNWEIFKLFIKGEYNRKGFPGGKLGGFIFLIIILIVIIIIALTKGYITI